jgi:GST-like protein
MIDLYTWGTPNGRKVSIALEEMGLEYKTHAVNITKDEQFEPSFLEISPNNKIPAIVDHDSGISLMESGAILLYLAKKSGTFMPKEGSEDYWRCIEWLMWQMGGFGPMLGQAHHFLRFNPGKSEYAERRFGDEAERLYDVLDQHLENREFVAGSYSIADMAIFPWCARWQWHKVDLGEFDNVKRWFLNIAGRPAVQKGYCVPNPDEIPLP